MKSALPKVLHEVCGRPLIEYVLDAARAAGVGRIVAVVGPPGRSGAGLSVAVRRHRVRAAVGTEGDRPRSDDVPRATRPTSRSGADSRWRHAAVAAGIAGGVAQAQHEQSASAVIGTAETAANQGLGRIVRDDQRRRSSRSSKRRTPRLPRTTIQEINTGCYAFDAQRLLAVARSHPSRTTPRPNIT